MAKTYYEKLKDPRWQRKRLEVMQRDDFACTRCGAKDETLNVHHWSYSKSGNPWDVGVDDLDTVCEYCHGKIEGMLLFCKLAIKSYKNLDFSLKKSDEDDLNEMAYFFRDLFNPKSNVHKKAKSHFRSLKKLKENG